MTHATPAGTTTATTATGTGRPSGVGAPGSALVTDRGRTTIADAVVGTVAGLAVQAVPGVHAVGGGTARAVGAVRDRFSGGRADDRRGITVEVGEREATVAVDLVADYGVPLADLSARVRREVAEAVGRLTGLAVTRVDVTVDDVFLAGLDDADGSDATTKSTGPVGGTTTVDGR